MPPVRDPMLLIGGSGIVGRWTARFLRAAHPGAPLLIGGRDLAKSEKAAAVDVERLTKTMPAALTRRDGAFIWRMGEEARAEFRAVDGTRMEASALGPYDVVGLATATGAPNVQFNLAMGVSSSRRRGEPMSTEIIIELAGADDAGQPLRSRHAVVHPEGQMPLTGLGVALVVERLMGLDGAPAVPAGLYFPHQLLEASAYLRRLKQAGGVILNLEVM